MIRGMNKRKAKGAPAEDTRGESDLAALKKASAPGPRARPERTEALLDERAAQAKAWARYSIRVEHECVRDLRRAAARRDAALDALKQAVRRPLAVWGSGGG